MWSLKIYCPFLRDDVTLNVFEKFHSFKVFVFLHWGANVWWICINRWLNSGQILKTVIYDNNKVINVSKRVLWIEISTQFWLHTSYIFDISVLNFTNFIIHQIFDVFILYNPSKYYSGIKWSDLIFIFLLSFCVVKRRK